MSHQAGQFPGRLPGEEKKRQVQSGQVPGHLLQPLEHKAVLAPGGPEKRRRQAEHHSQGLLQAEGQFLGVEQGPVVPDPLVPAHPVDHRSLAGAGLIQGAYAGAVDHKVLSAMV